MIGKESFLLSQKPGNPFEQEEDDLIIEKSLSKKNTLKK